MPQKSMEHYPMYMHNESCRGKGEGKGLKNIWGNNCWYLPNLMKNINLHIQESQKTPSSINLDPLLATSWN